jgi:hypothetical protein
LKSVDLSTLWFYVPDDLMPTWQHKARIEVGHQILERSADGKPIVIEAAYGPDAEAPSENPFRLTISDLFMRLSSYPKET